jgi:hypothetical protein
VPSPFPSFKAIATAAGSPRTIALTIVGGLIALTLTIAVALRVSGVWTGVP